MTHPSDFRRILAVIDTSARAAEAAAMLAQRSGARLTVIQAWRVPMVFWSQPVLASSPVAIDDVLREAEHDAALHLTRIINDLASGPVTFSCRRGRSWLIAVREMTSSRYDAIVVDRRSHRLAATADRFLRSRRRHLYYWPMVRNAMKKAEGGQSWCCGSGSRSAVLVNEADEAVDRAGA